MAPSAGVPPLSSPPTLHHRSEIKGKRLKPRDFGSAQRVRAGANNDEASMPNRPAWLTRTTEQNLRARRIRADPDGHTPGRWRGYDPRLAARTRGYQSSRGTWRDPFGTDGGRWRPFSVRGLPD